MWLLPGNMLLGFAENTWAFFLSSSQGCVHILISKLSFLLIDSETLDPRHCFFCILENEGLAEGLKMAWPWFWEAYHTP